ILSKVLFFNIPAHGHTYPTLPLVAELVRRGEQVVYYSSPAFRQPIEQVGAMFRNSVTPFLNDETQIEENMVKVAYMLLQGAESALAVLLQQVREDTPDYIIHDGLCPWGKYIAQIMGVPSICSMTTFAIPPVTGKNFVRVIKTPGNMRLLFSTPIARMLFEGRNQLIPFRNLSNQLHKKYGIAKPQVFDMFTNRAMMNIVYSTKHFQPFIETFDDTFKFVGPSIVTRSDTISFPFEALGETPAIYISLGTVFNDKADFYRMCYEAFADIGRTVVLSVGKRTNIAALGTAPRNFIVQEFVSQLELLQRIALFVTHGGMNSVSEALYYGVPLVVIPQSADQNLVGQRIEQLGAGKALSSSSVTAQKLHTIAEDILAHPAYQQASAQLGKSFGKPEGYLRAADEIQTFKRIHSIS
ncbi:MAG TPA: macrolide family glycosyltransferase, partial [Ktedonobacteraceae bacterium]